MIRPSLRAPQVARGCAAAAFAVLAALGSGCASSAREVREKTSREWYDEGRVLAGRDRLDEAVSAFQEAAKGYRNADLDADIQLALADAQFAKEEYPAAVEAYAEFLRLHPHSGRADYAQHRIGLSWMRQMRSADRSQEPTRKAAAAFEAFLGSYPRSPLAGEAKAALEACRLRLAEHELVVGDFYQRRGAYAAAAGRYEVVLREYADRGVADRALYQLGRCYRMLRQEEKAARSFEQLRREYPASRFVKEIDGSKG